MLENVSGGIQTNRITIIGIRLTFKPMALWQCHRKQCHLKEWHGIIFASIFLLDILERVFGSTWKPVFSSNLRRQTYLSHLRPTYVTVASHLRHQTDLQLCRSYQSWNASRAVWPDVRIKSSPTFQNVAQKEATTVYFKRGMFLK